MNFVAHRTPPHRTRRHPCILQFTATAPTRTPAHHWAQRRHQFWLLFVIADLVLRGVGLAC